MIKAIISIIGPVYNVEDYIEKCIKSILDQSFREFELILVDDGSLDMSGKICDEYAKNDQRIKVIHKKNGGVSSARNEGIKVARGEYIAFVDSDDFINKDMYKILYKNSKEYDADISVCDFEYVSNNKESVGITCEFKNNIVIYSNEEALNKLYSNENIKFIVAWNKLYKKYLFSSIYYDINRCHEDEFIIHKLFYNANKIVSCSEKLYYYYENYKSTMRVDFNINRLDIIEAMKSRMNFFRKKNLIELEYKTQNMYLYYFIPYYYRTKNKLKNKSKSKELKKDFKKVYKYLLKNPKYNIKAKILWFIFLFSPSLYYFIMRVHDKEEFERILNI